MPRLVDLSVTLENDRHWAPWWAANRVKYQSHRLGRWVMWWLFGVQRKHLPHAWGWANETIQLSTHGTTHVDAPWHYSPTCAGQPARTIDQLPLDWFFAPGVKLDVRHLPSFQAATVAHLEEALECTGHELQPGDIVLIQTGNDQRLGSESYFHEGSGVSAAATRWLIDQGVRVMGIDAWGWDTPLRDQARRARRERRNDLFWGAHFVGIDHEYCQIERLTGLDQLPACGFQVCAFPLKVKGGSAGPARVVAILNGG